MRGKLIVLLVVFLAALAPVGGQGPNAYFSLSTNKTYLPGEKIGIRVYTSHVDQLEFRVYKVKDAATFFERLDNAHTFGHTTPKEHVDNESFLERFQDWKHDLWVDIRDFFRYQFSARSRAAMREEHEVKVKTQAQASPTADVFAQVPVLNSTQLVARWHQAVPPQAYYEMQNNVPVENLPKGVYLVEATDGSLRAYTVLIVSELALVTKTTQGQVLTFAADRRSGAPVSGADVRVWSDEKEKAHLKSGPDGLAEGAIPQGQYQDFRVLAVHDDDVALVTPYSYNLSSNPAEDWTGYVYTDRPVYRPTHTVHFKAILRSRAGEHFKIPTGEQVQVLIEDPDSKPVFQATLPVSSYGTVHGDLDLSATAALGYYSISLSGRGGQRYPVNGGFYVEEYKKPEYEVKVTPTAPRILQGGSIEATLEARYYFGEPVANADVKYVVHVAPYWSPFIDRDEDEGLPEQNFDSDGGDDEGDYAGEQLSEQSGKLDADGKLKVRIPTRIDEHHRDARYRIEARVTDAANREIAGHSFVTATYGSFAVGISGESYVYQVGDTVRAIAVAKDYDGNPVQTPVHVELVRSLWYRGSDRQETVLASQDAQTAADGTARVTFAAKEAGSLFLRVKAQTPEKRQVEGETYLWITSSDSSWWGSEQREIRMVADKKSYKVGDTAHVLVLTGIPDAYLLVTTEARTIQTKRLVHAPGASITLDVPITGDAQPNVFLSAVFLHDNKLYSSVRSLKVPAVQQKLQIDIQPSQKQFQPGQKASYTLLVHDSTGKPVAGEFSIGVVDEAIYAIRPDTAGDPFDLFYGPAYDSVALSSSLNFFFSGDAGKRQMFLAYGGGSGSGNARRALAQLKPEALVQPKVRKLFPDTALWLSDVHTDASGRADAQLTFPDSLTTWRATVRGVTSDTKVGAATNTVIVRKNVMVRLAVPRFFRQGDEVTVSVIVHNYLATAKTVRVSLDLKGLDVLAGQASQVEVPSKGEAKVDWRVRAQSLHETDLLAKALTNEESDAMEINLPVIPVGVKQTDAKSGSISGDGDQKATVTLPGDPNQSAPGLDITLSPSLAGSIFSALDYLTSYPYGCTEQTMSSFLPNIVVAKAMKELKLQATVDTPELEKKIAAGMDRLKDFQHQDGGWGWWKEDDSQVFMTAYVVSGFGQAREVGYDPGADSLNRAIDYLHSALSQHENMRYDLRAYVVYALALNHAAKPEELADAWKNHANMTTEGLAMLGLALLSAGDQAKAQEIAATMESQAVVNDFEASWPSAYDYLMEFEMDEGAETTAYAVRLLSLVKPQSPLLPKAALWLVNHREGYYWFSTKQTAMVIFGLTDYVKSSHELDANFRAEVYVNGKQVIARQFTSADAWNPAPPSIHLDASQLTPGANEIRVHKSGSGRLYWSATGTYFSSDKRLVQNNKLSLNITRDYFKLTPDQLNGRIVYNLDPLQGPLQVGDILAVRITVAGSNWRYLLIEDPIPAGSEFITRDDLYELKQRPSWWEYWFTRREFHDDRAAIFQTYFSGVHQYVYLLKIVNPGKFQVSPAMVQPMYQPSIMATTDAAVVEVK